MRRTVLGEAPLVAVLVVVLGGFAYLAVQPAHWLRGVLIVSGGMLLAGVLRALLADRMVGMLAVRGKAFDTVCYVVLGVGIAAFGITLPR